MINRLFITGAAGFIGSNLIDRLLETGHSVMGVDNFDPFYSRIIKEQNIQTALKHPNFVFKEGDVRDVAFIDNCLSQFRPELVVHLAAKAGVRPSLINPMEYCSVNVVGTLHLLEMMRKNNITKMIFASSSSVYGNNKKVPFSEADNVDHPISPYAATKKAGELLCHTYHHLYKFDIFCLRFFTVYGPRQRPDLAIHKFTKALLNDEIIHLYGNGSNCRDYTHINDIIQGVTSAIEHLSGFDIFNLGESITVSLIDLVSILENCTNKKAKINYLPLQEGDVIQTLADISKAKEKLNYNPSVDLETGIMNYIKRFILKEEKNISGSKWNSKFKSILC